MTENKTCKSGKWIDTDTGQVVDAAPERGIQLVPPGAELTPDRIAAVKAAEEAAKTAPETASAPTATENTSKPPSIEAVLAEVGEDTARAQVALDEERARPKPRKGIVEPLEKLIADS